MLTTFFTLCAVVGGVVFAIQFVMLLIGFGGEDADFADDIPDDIPDDISVDTSAGDALDASHGHAMGHDSSWLFGAISLRTLVAAMLFFGLCGIAAQQAGLGDAIAFLIALAGGSIALFGVHFIMKTLYRLGQDSTVRIERAVGRRAAVYVPIPPNKSGIGKIQIKLQDRLMEYAAMTAAADKIPTGARVEVVSLVSPTTLEVQPLTASKPAKEK